VEKLYSADSVLEITHFKSSSYMPQFAVGLDHRQHTLDPASINDPADTCHSIGGIDSSQNKAEQSLLIYPLMKYYF
jgi:hypothetical protein